MIDDIMCNDGKMLVEIVESELVGNGMKKYTQYHIRGRDSLGDIDVNRRYSEFLIFKEILFQRWPGLFIPPVPPKQNKNHTTDTFVEERQYFLNVFLQKLCSQTYLCSTPEVQVFFRPKGKVEESFKAISRTTTDFVLQYYFKNIPLNNWGLPEKRVEQYNQDINEFVKEQKILMDYLKNFKQHIKDIVPIKDEELKYYKQFAEFLVKYEDHSDKTATSLGSLD